MFPFNKKDADTLPANIHMRVCVGVCTTFACIVNKKTAKWCRIVSFNRCPAYHVASTLMTIGQSAHGASEPLAHFACIVNK